MRQWAILIGLNDYQHFQPLSFAQQDAQDLHRFLTTQAGFPPEQCLLLTDTSPFLWGKPTLPTQANLLSWVELLAQNCLKPEDTLWVFFSGYGICHEGVDYLVPADGNPAAIAETCIPLSMLLGQLQFCLGAGASLVLLDISRIQGTPSNEVIGMQTAQLAYQAGIATILSCQPGQYSREISSLGHGLFTAALLEGLRYDQAATLATLVRFLSDRVPELSEHYYQPSQTPFPICPAKRAHKPLLATLTEEPQASTNGHAAPTPAAPTYVPVKAAEELSTTGDAPMAVSLAMAVERNGTGRNGHQPNGIAPHSVNSPTNATVPASVYGTAGQPHLSNSAVVAGAVASLRSLSANGSNGSASSSPTVASMSSNSQPQNVAVSNSPAAESQEDAPDGALWLPLLLGGLLSLGLVGCVLWRNWSLLGTPSQAVASSTQSKNVSVPASQSAPSPAPDQNGNAQTATNAPAGTAIAANPEQTRGLDFNPTAAPDQATGQTLLASARKMVLSDQATPYRDAIDAAKRIPPQDASYAEAQQDIAVWSQTILDLAQRRADQKQWDIAIMAADLVPADNVELRTKAQAAIAQWCPLVKSQPVINFTIRRSQEICNSQPL